MKKLFIFLAFFIVNYALCIVHCHAQTKQLWGMTYQGGQYDAGIIFNTDSSGNNEAVQYNFVVQTPGANPTFGNLMQATDGNLYGMTFEGGANNDGVLFQYNPATSTYTKKIDFAGTSNGVYPEGSLIQASDGNLYGMTEEGGANNYGVLFQYNPTTSTLTKKIDFTGTANGSIPFGSLIQASDGNLYGMTLEGGANGEGVLFQYNTTTSTLTKKIDFAGISNGASPHGSLIQASDGNLYGMTEAGGANGEGVLFQYNLSTSTLTKKIDFTGAANGEDPYGSLVQASDGNLYGLTYEGGANNDGALFQYNTSASTLTKMIDFAGTSNGKNPEGSLIQASDGNLYGMTYDGGANNEGVLFQYNTSTSTLTKKIDFAGAANGENPDGSLIQASDGNLYGMTSDGGVNNEGVLFQYNTSTSALTKKIDFAGAANGEDTYGSLIQASDGNLYGMTYGGGTNNEGVLFQYNPTTSTLTKKIDFAGTSNGANPYGSLMQASDGNLYGMTYGGGTNNDGVLFQYNPSTSTLTKKIDFAGAANGKNPWGFLVQASDGNLYGMTEYGGANNDGVLFQYNPTSSTLTKKIDFAGTSNGTNPFGSLIQASDGNLYGMTEAGGANGEGVLFQYNTSTSTLTKKIDFAGTSNGAYPGGSLIQASDGNLYGMTPEGGANSNDGVLFQYNPSTSALTKKIDFAGAANGEQPRGSLIQASDGNLYGMTADGGANGEGVLFQYNPVTSTLTKKLDFNGANGQYPQYTNLIEITLTCTATASSNSPVCAGSTLNLTSSSGTSYSWTGPNSFTSTLQNPSITNVTSANAGTYTVTVTNSNGCYASASAAVSITATLAGTYTVGTGGNYATLTSAVAAYNTSCLGGAVIFSLTSNYSSTGETFPISINNNTMASAVNTLTIKPGTGVTAAITGANSYSLIVFNGCSYVTLDGSNGNTTDAVCPVSAATCNLTITNNSATFGATSPNAVVWIQNNGTISSATHNTVMNCIINYTGLGAGTGIGIGGNSGTYYSLMFGNSNNYNSIINNNIATLSSALRGYGIIVQGGSAANKDQGNYIAQNTVGSPSAAPLVSYIFNGGIVAGWQDGITISGNKVNGVYANSYNSCGIGLGVVNTASGGLVGFSNSSYSGNEVTNATITNNIVGLIGDSAVGTQASVAGIVVVTASSGTTLIANNSVSGVYASDSSIYITAGILSGGGGATTNIFYNSINMSSTFYTNAKSQPYYALAIGGANPIVNIKNNIICTNLSGTTSYLLRAIGLDYSTFTNLNSNYNDIYVNGTNASLGQTGGLSSSGIARSNLAAWQAATGQDANSKSVAPVFLSSTDLHLNATNSSNLTNLAGTGTPVSVTNDVNCKTRNATAPCIGFDEFTACANPTLAASASPSAICIGSSSVLTANCSANCSGVTYSWSPGGASTSSVSVSPATATTYTVTGTSSAGGCSATTTVTVIVNLLPTATASNNSPLCSGSILNLFSGGGTSYSWSGPNSFSSSLQNPSITNVATVNGGTYIVTVTNSNGCTATASTTVIVNQTPTINPVANQSLCSGNSTTAINFSGTGSGTVYNWTNSSTSIGLAASGTGNIASFTATNSGGLPVTATITATPVSSGFAYITNNGSNSVSVINTLTNTVSATITVGSQPVGVAISPDGSKVYVTNSGSNTVSVINTASNTITATISVGAVPFGITISPDGSLLYVANNNANTVSVINTTTNTVLATIVVSFPRCLAFSPDGSKVYVTKNASSAVAVISTATNTVTATISVGSSPFGISVSPDGTTVYVANLASNTVSVINASTNSVTATVSVGNSPSGIAVSPDGSKVYAASQVTLGTVSVISTATNTVTSTITVGAFPNGISVSPDGSSVYVANSNSGNVSVINAATNAVSSTISVGTSPFAVGNFVTGISCSGTPATFTITVNPTTTATALSNSPVCSGNTINLSSSGGTSYSWSGPNSFTSTLQNPSIANAASANAGAYTVTATGSGGCSATASATVIVNQTPTINSVPNQTLCNGFATTAINFSGTGSAYNWTNSATSIGLAAGGNGNIASFTATNSGASPVTATITATPALLSGFAYITNKNDGTVSVINIATNSVTATVTVGNTPQGISVSPDGSRAYIANSNSSSNNVSVLNTFTNTIIATIATGTGPNGIVVSPNGTTVYVTNHASNTVSVINAATYSVTATIAVGTNPVGITISPDGSTVYVANSGSGTVSVINTASNTVTTTITVGTFNLPYGLIITPDGSKVYVANNGTSNVSVISTATNTITATISVGNSPYGICVSPDGSKVYVVDNGSNKVSVINTSVNTVTATINVGSSPEGISISPDGSTVFVANFGSNTVSVINTAANTVTATITVGSGPVALGNFVTGSNCSGNPATFNITVNPTPTATALSNSPVCSGSSLTLSASSGTSYSWSGPNNFSSTLQNANITNAATANAGTYTVTAANVYGCTGSATTAVVVNVPDSWTQEANFGGMARRSAVGFSIGTKGYIGTGSDVNGNFYQDFWEWDQTTNTWTQKANFPGTARVSAVGFSIGSKGYIGTGVDNIPSFKKDFWEWDQTNNVWTQKTDFPGAGRQGAVGFSIATKGYIGTGFENNVAYYEDFWEWDQATNIWTQKADFVGPIRAFAASFSIGTKGYIGTGYDGTIKYNDFWEWDQTSNQWTQKANLGGAVRNSAIGFSIGTTGYIGMGYGLATFPNDFWQWDQASNTWYLRAIIPGNARTDAVGFSIGSYGYVGTGQDATTAYLQDFWQYSPVCPTTNAISTSAISGTTFCASNPISVPFIVSGTFNSGNVFTAQLSDATGNFASPVQIGTLSGTTSGTISCIIPSNATAGAAYRIRVVSSNPIVTGSDNGSNITIGTPATVSGNTPLCSGSTLNLSASGGTSYLWTGPNGFSSSTQNPSISSASTTASGTYSVTVSNICGSTTTATSVIVNALPTAVLSGGGKVCSGVTSASVSIALTGSSPWALTYSINGVNQTPVTGIASSPYIIGTTTAGTYSVTALSDANCSGTSLTGSATVIVNPLPTATVSGGGSVCSGSTLPNVNIVLTGTQPWTLTYSVNGVNQTPISGITTSPYIITGAAAGIYMVTALSDANCGATSFMGSATVIVNSLPNNPGNPTSNSPQCANAGVTLIASGTAPASETWYWEAASSGTSTANPATSTYNVTSSGTYYIRSQNNTTTCWSAGAGSATVTVNPLPTATASSNSPICVGGNLNLSAGGGTSYSWTGPGGFTSTQQNPTVNNVTSSGTYTVIVTNVNGCSKSASTNISVQSCRDHVTMSATNCTQTSATQMTIDLYIVDDGDTSLKLNSVAFGLNVNSAVLNGGTLSWAFSGNSDLPPAITSFFTFPPYNTTAHELRLSSSVNSITSGTAPSLPFNTSVHIGTFTITNTNSWAANSATSFTIQTSTGANLTNSSAAVYVNGASGTTTLSTTGINRDVSVSCGITLNPTAPSFPTAGNNGALCSGSTLNLTSSAGAGTAPFSYAWKGPNGFSSSLQNPSISSVTTAAGGTYSVTISNFSGSTSATTSVSVNPNSMSNISQTECNSYAWNGATYSSSGTYTFDAGNTNSYGCDSIATLNLTINYSSASSTSSTACDNYSWNGSTYSASGTYTYDAGSRSNAAGCDSVATLNLTINNSSASSNSVTACNTYIWNNATYTTSGIYTYDAGNSNSMGCDSVATLNLIVNYSSASSTSATTCGSYVWNGTTYSATGIYTFDAGSTINAAGCDSVATLHLTITGPCSATLSLKIFIQGYYKHLGSSTPMDNLGAGGCLYVCGISSNPAEVDTVTIYLMDPNTQSQVGASVKGILHTDGSVWENGSPGVTFPLSVIGNSYYIKITHRSAMETWSANPVLLSASASYDFSSSLGQAYGNNMIQTDQTIVVDNIGGNKVYAFYNGDVFNALKNQSYNQDGVIESGDYSLVEDDYGKILFGYYPTDVTGDGVVESSDFSLIEENYDIIIFAATPW